MSRAVTSSDIQVLKCQPEWQWDRAQPRPGHFLLCPPRQPGQLRVSELNQLQHDVIHWGAGQSLPGSVRTGQQDKHLYPEDNIYPRNEFGLLLNNVFLIDNNGTDCGRDKEEEIYITSASVIELDCKKCADNDSYDSGIYNASTNTGNNTDLPQNLCYNILPHMKDQLSNCQSSVSIRLFPTFLWKFLISCRH